MTYPTISELEKRIEQLEKTLEELEPIIKHNDFICKVIGNKSKLDGKRIERLEGNYQFLAKRLDAQASRISVLEGHPKNFEKTTGE